MLDIFKNLFDCCLIEYLKIAYSCINKPIYKAFISQNLFDCCLINKVDYFYHKEVIRFKFNKYKELKC